jgi:hypothetical protein
MHHELIKETLLLLDQVGTRAKYLSVLLSQSENRDIYLKYMEELDRIAVHIEETVTELS